MIPGSKGQKFDASLLAGEFLTFESGQKLLTPTSIYANNIQKKQGCPLADNPIKSELF